MYNNLRKFIDKYTSFKEKYEKSETFERTALCDIMERNMSDKSYPFKYLKVCDISNNLMVILK